MKYKNILCLLLLAMFLNCDAVAGDSKKTIITFLNIADDYAKKNKMYVQEWQLTEVMRLRWQDVLNEKRLIFAAEYTKSLNKNNLYVFIAFSKKDNTLQKILLIDYKTLKIIAENTIFLQELPLEKLITTAEKELVKVYGKRVLKQRPWKITRNDEKSITLTGTFHVRGVGGVAEITLQKSDGKVLRMIHGK